MLNPTEDISYPEYSRKRMLYEIQRELKNYGISLSGDEPDIDEQIRTTLPK